MSILIQYIDPNFKCYPLLYCPNIRNPVGKDAEYALKVIAKLSDKEMEKWARENYMDKKGFTREWDKNKNILEILIDIPT